MSALRSVLAGSATLALAVSLAFVLPAVVAPPATSAPMGCDDVVSNYTPVSIPETGTVTTTIDLSSYAATGDSILDVDVGFRLYHEHLGDLVISLEYKGETALLSSRNGGSGTDYGATAPAVFDDASTTPITAASPPFTGIYRPEESLDVFDDLNPGGVWTLRIQDVAELDSGQLYSFLLFFDTEFCDDADKDRVKDSYDDCPAVKGVAPTGCPERSRSLTFRYSASAEEFRGRLSCAATPRCAYGKPVRIYRAVSGDDKVIARVRTDNDGDYRFRRADPVGTYYAVAPKVYQEDVAVCSRVGSGDVVP
jgi:subtilisin-like proprotein convertase family protein